MLQTLKTILILLVVAALFGGVYYILSRSGYFADGMKTAEDVRNATDKLQNDILGDIDRVKVISLDKSLFDVPEFKALVDTAVVVDAQPISRPNPFDRY
ncbi:MAG: hypothetical protein KBD24_02110 [Candidatus Pacebacteria bacterium]|nr:hypothetical protein [Candidatus Paceibacterota bacterium]